MTPFPAVLLYECVEKVDYHQYLLSINKVLSLTPSAIPRVCYTGVLLVGGISAHHPAGTQQENPEIVGS